MASEHSSAPPLLGGSSRSRQLGLRAPALSTPMSGPQMQLGAHLGAFQAPPSPTSLSLPFAGYSPSLGIPSPGGMSRGPSPLASRSESTATVPYNPQQWGPTGSSPVIGAGYSPQGRFTGSTSRSVVAARDGLGLEAPVPSPPPPYSPKRPSQASPAPTPGPASASATADAYSSPSQAVSPATNPSQYTTPISAATSASPAGTAGHRATPLQRPLSLYQTSSPEVMRSSQTYPPPPTSLASGKRSRSSSRDPSDRSQTLFSLSALRQRPKQVPPPTTQSAIDVLQHHTNEVLARAPTVSPDGTNAAVSSSMAQGSYSSSRTSSLDVLPRAPGSRRAASTGNIDSNAIASGPSRRGSRSPSRNGWEPGMPLPPPPPGPPPPNARSQSLSRSSEGSSSSRNLSTPVAAPITRRPPGLGTSLGPVPPTPAGWVDEEYYRRDRSTSRQGRELHIDTSSVVDTRASSSGRDADFTTLGPRAAGYANELSQSSDDPMSGDLVRSAAIRDMGNKGIRERRSESRTGKGRVAETGTSIEQNNNPWADDMAKVKPADLVLPTTGPTLTRRRTITKSSPRSAKFMRSPEELLNSSKSAGSSGAIEGVDSARSTPRIGSGRRVEVSATFEPTPPFSPEQEHVATSPFSRGPAASLAPKSLPTPPPQRHGESSKQLSLDVHSLTQQRPISHILHTPNTDASIQAPLSPSRPPSQRSDYGQVVLGGQESFARSTIARHTTFAEREASAKSDRERVEMFAEFIVTESRLRRERYAVALDSMGPTVDEMLKDLFKPMSSDEREAAYTVSPSSGSGRSMEHSGRASHRGSLDAALRSSIISSVQLPSREPDSPISSTSNGQGRPESGWVNGYMPSLSPIPSMGMSTIPDELSSRGRAPSRWWEASQDGSTNGGFSRGLERSKRESKYMGVPRELRESLQWDGVDRSSPLGRYDHAMAPGSNRQTLYGPDEYPPEKTGWHDQDAVLPPPPPPPKPASPYTPALSTPNPRHLDVSRLVTLPPPYPRHHPAVNNSHPELVTIRTVVRSLSDFSEPVSTKEWYETSTAATQEQARQTTSKRRNQFRADIQRQVSNGTMTYANAAAAEAAAEDEEAQRSKERTQSEFDLFQSEVMKPLHILFTERISKATVAFEELRGNLFVDAQDGSPNMPQEQGDEQPELLEKLTLLKWLFEAREQLHREVYDLLTERNNKYKSIVTSPYCVAGNEEKAREADNFFRKDAEERKVCFEKETLKRVEEFMHIVEENVVRGVEVQLSAFWDIAPSLRAVLEKVPRDLRGFDIQIPADEYEENPQYMQFPLQYLYSLLGHSEKSTYQFIESQINLLCLLHEVKSAVTASTCRLMETQRYLAGEDFASVEMEMTAVRKDEDGRLTDDLKEKVGTVEELWAEALGRGLDGVKFRVRDWLIRRGGWEDVDDS
ncbi:MAG: hypothetical protein M1812_005226 [Candelaria pacifica]|nr:MAG: hypothetical protein M1812_005226 [Candelaria pacifica]